MSSKGLWSRVLALLLAGLMTSVGWQGILAQPAGGTGAVGKASPIATLSPGKISGTVTLPDMKTPVMGVRVILRDKVTGQEVASATTNVKGEYVLKNVPEGSYDVLAGNPLFAMVQTEIQVARGAPLKRLDFAIGRALAAALGAEEGVVAPVAPPAGVPGVPRRLPTILSAKVLIGIGSAIVIGGIVALLAEEDKDRKPVFVSPVFP